MNNTSRAQFLKTLAVAPLVWGMERPAHAIRANDSSSGGSATGIQYIKKTWARVPGQMFSVTAGLEGSVYGLGMDASNPAGRPIFKWNPGNQTWMPVPGLAQRLAIANNGDLWAVNGQQQIFRMTGFGASWVLQFGTAVDVSARGEVWVVGSQRQAFRFNGRAWDASQTSNTLKVAAGATPGEAYVLTADGKLFASHRSDITAIWQGISTTAPLRDITSDAQGLLWTIDSQNNLGKINPQRPTDRIVVEGGSGVSISASASEIWLTNAAGEVFRTTV